MRIMRHLGREDWIQAGLEALAAGGAAGFRIGTAARHLGVTKGSFYWHFSGRAAWRDAVLAYWEHRAFAALVRKRPGGRAVADWAAAEPALRLWAEKDAAVAMVLTRVLRERTMAAGQAGLRRVA